MWGHVALSAGKAGAGRCRGRLWRQPGKQNGWPKALAPDEAIIDAAVWKARLYLMSGDLASASSEQERAARVGEVRPYSRELGAPLAGTAAVARNEPGEALQLLAQLHETAETAGTTVQILALQALALQAIGERERAVSTLAEALALAEPEGYVRTFADEGPRDGRAPLQGTRSPRSGQPGPSRVPCALPQEAPGGAGAGRRHRVAGRQRGSPKP